VEGPASTPSRDGDLRCYNDRRRKLLWSKNFPTDYGSESRCGASPPTRSWTATSFICLVGGSNDRLVVAFDKTTGVLWRRRTAPRLRLLPAEIYESAAAGS